MKRSISCVAAALAVSALSGGCAAMSVSKSESQEARSLAMFSARQSHAGVPLDWSDAREAIAWADVVIVGEQHDDALGHGVELAIYQEALSLDRSTALSLEMLERDEQILVEDYLEGILDAEQFEKQTFSTNWGGKGMWGAWYQPLIDEAKRAGAPVVAANAPRRYVRLARLEGYERIKALPPDRRQLVAMPGALPAGEYWTRFQEVMSGSNRPEAGGSDDRKLSEKEIKALFRSQLVWDATMADSIVKALRKSPQVVHIVGQFHSDFEGGTVLELRRRKPGVRILVISLQRNDPENGALREDDRGRADIVIYTGARPLAQCDEESDDLKPPPSDSSSG